MSQSFSDHATEPGRNGAKGLRAWLLRVFLRVGVLPFLLVAAVTVFSVLSDQFLTVQNLTNLIRQSVYLILVSLGQMLALATGGLDLSVGTVLALTSVVSASVMSSVALGPTICIPKIWSYFFSETIFTNPSDCPRIDAFAIAENGNTPVLTS